MVGTVAGNIKAAQVRELKRLNRARLARGEPARDYQGNIIEPEGGAALPCEPTPPIPEAPIQAQPEGERAERERNTDGLKRGNQPGLIPARRDQVTVTTDTVSHGGIADCLAQHQALAFEAIGEQMVGAARYLGRVASGRIKGEQWRMRAAESLLDRGGVVAATIDRARDRAAAADAASLAPLLARLAQAQALAARKASATDAETGQTSGTPDGE